MKLPWWKLAVIGGVIVWALFYAWPRAERPFLNMKLGLDLKGGSHLVMQVVTEDAIKAECDLVATRIGEKLRKGGFPEVRVTVTDAAEVLVAGIPAGRGADVEAAIKDEISGWPQSVSGDTLTIAMPSAEKEAVKETAVKQALTTITNRIDAFGVGETNIQRLGGAQRDRILVELPGVEDPGRVKSIIQTQARLELRAAYYAPDGRGPFSGPTKEAVVAALGGALPPGVDVLPHEATDKQTLQKLQTEWMAVEKASVITGGDLQDARPTRDQWGSTVVSFQLRVQAAERFSTFTRGHIGKLMPIVLDNKIVSAPSIRGEIGMNGQIEGGFTPLSAEDLSLQLRAGALPARVQTIEERTVGPSLGKDSIDAGLFASLVGSIGVCLFMLAMYKLSGLNALVALALNVLILAAAMASIGATLTLPGIGGYALTIGMAVDANVLIFERIREEMRNGRAVRDALHQGFNRALPAIFDSNLTTIISALFLMQYGTGPVRGFAVSLTIGLLANMFTAVFVSRVLFDLQLGNRQVQKLSI